MGNDLHSILIYRVSVSSSGVEATRVQTLQFPSSVWDCVFADDGILFVLTAEKPHLRRFRNVDDVHGNVEQKKRFEEIDLPALSFEGADDSMEALEASLASATKAPSLFAVLTKSKIDNMKAYLETKEKRLAGGNVRWGGNKKAVSEERTEDARDKPKKMKVAC